MMVCYVYNPNWVMTIAICDIQSKDVDNQCLLWFALIEHMKKHGVYNVSFQGFMVDSAQSYWISV